MLGGTFLLANLKGKDLLKRTNHYIPESIGLIAASVYIGLLILFIPFPFSDFLQNNERKNQLEGLAKAEFPHQQLSVYLAAILSLLTATLLGFLDDVFDIRWRYKLPIPIIASVPLLLVYFAEGGNTHVVVPKPLRGLLRASFDLGPLYYVYMSMLSTFCTNSINILAGMNGLEATQALIIAISVAINDVLYLPWNFKLFGLIPCPRHRVPMLDSKPSSNLLHPSLVDFPRPLSPPALFILRTLAKLRLTRLIMNEESGVIYSATNLTLPNAILVIAGPMKEKNLTLAVGSVCSTTVIDDSPWRQFFIIDGPNSDPSKVVVTYFRTQSIRSSKTYPREDNESSVSFAIVTWPNSALAFREFEPNTLNVMATRRQREPPP
ncbi:tunicamycin resistance protein [Tulasnella sp. 403]|nr:tunicamycin resistance protein [Tulasnella sp. 403]